MKGKLSCQLMRHIGRVIIHHVKKALPTTCNYPSRNFHTYHPEITELIVKYCGILKCE